MEEKYENEKFLVHEKFSKESNGESFEYQSRVTIVKFQSSRGTKKLQIIDDFDAESWIKIETLLTDEFIKFQNYTLNLIQAVISITFSISKRRRDSLPSDPANNIPDNSQYKKERNTRSTKLRNQ
jgi:hypothetical protein